MIDKAKWIKGIAHWVEGNTAFVSIAFTWRLLEAKAIAASYRDQGLLVRAGGPAVFPFKNNPRNPLAGVAELGGDYPDAVARHNPMATFASRGCSVGCWFCTVPTMEGKSFTLIPDFPVRPILCDNNLSALDPKFQQHIVNRYLQTGVPLLDANSGFEPATFDDEVFARWKSVLRGPWRFGYDEGNEGENVRRVMHMLRDVSPRRKQVYTMIGHEPFDVCMERIRRVIDWGGEPYAQPFMLLNALEKKPHIRHDWTELKLRQVQRWVNRHLWRKVPFSEYDASAKTSNNKIFKGVSMAKQAKQQPIQVSAEYHSKLTGIAAERERGNGGSRVSLRSLVEEALVAHYPQLAGVGQAAAPRSTDADESVMLALLAAVITGDDDPIAQSKAIEALQGAIPGSMGQNIKLRDLAYHLRSAMNSGDIEPPDTLGALIASYEGGS